MVRYGITRFQSIAWNVCCWMYKWYASSFPQRDRTHSGHNGLTTSISGISRKIAYYYYSRRTCYTSEYKKRYTGRTVKSIWSFRGRHLSIENLSWPWMAFIRLPRIIANSLSIANKSKCPIWIECGGGDIPFLGRNIHTIPFLRDWDPNKLPHMISCEL